MIIAVKHGCDILESDEKRIAFAVNTEGANDSGFAGIIACNYWPELADIGPTKLGSILTKKVDGIEFFALCCHSLKNGWVNQAKVIQSCFDAIPGNDPVASTSIGTGLIGILSGANLGLITTGMEASKTKIILY